MARTSYILIRWWW